MMWQCLIYHVDGGGKVQTSRVTVTREYEATDQEDARRKTPVQTKADVNTKICDVRWVEKP